MNIHEFALYVKNLVTLPIAVAQTTVITDEQFVHRVKRILRLESGDHLTLFDDQHHSLAKLSTISEKKIELFLKPSQPNSILQPALIVQLALLRREALDEAVAALVAVGVTDIQLVLSTKVQRAWGGVREYERLQRCMIAAAEQSKCFAFARLHEPISLSEVFSKNNGGDFLMCDAQGSVLKNDLKTDEPVTILIGPEGDFTESEKKLISDHNYQSWRLTPTVLRSEQAAALAAGIIRSR